MTRPLMLSAAVALVATAPLAAQEMPDSAQMARMMELAQPGPEHERLAALAGDWEATFQMPGLSFVATAENRMIMGGRFLASTVTGTAGAMPFEALTILGFDRGPGVYTAVGFDTFGTFYVTGAGPWNAAEDRAVLAGSYDDPVTGHAHQYEFVWTIATPDRYTWNVVFLEGGVRRTVMEGEYRRR